jgi:hypothetical protein
MANALDRYLLFNLRRINMAFFTLPEITSTGCLHDRHTYNCKYTKPVMRKPASRNDHNGNVDSHARSLKNKRRQVEIAPITGPFIPVNGRRHILLADAENLIYSAANLGFHLSVSELTRILRQNYPGILLHAFISVPQDRRDHRLDPFDQSGWDIHTNPIHEVKTSNGVRRRANSDNDMLFKSGWLLSRNKVETVIIGSGDGDLSDDLARAVSEIIPRATVWTLSLAGATSHRLNAIHNPWIAGNIEVGLDCLETGKEVHPGKCVTVRPSTDPVRDRFQKYWKKIPHFLANEPLIKQMRDFSATKSKHLQSGFNFLKPGGY